MDEKARILHRSINTLNTFMQLQLKKKNAKITCLQAAKESIINLLLCK